MSEIRIVFDGPPGPISGRFVEVEDPAGASIKAGEWHDRGDGMWELRVETAKEWKELAEARAKLLVCYRTGEPPSGALLDTLARLGVWAREQAHDEEGKR